MLKTQNVLDKGYTLQLGVKIIQTATASSAHDLSEYESMTKGELIQEVVKLRINEERLKKGDEAKGDGAEKVFLPLDNKNTK